MKKLWLYLHFPRLQLDSLPDHSQDVPVIILNAKNNQILQLNNAAIQKGIHIGMGLGTASALTSELQVEPYCIDVENNKVNEIADSLYLLTSDINIDLPNGLLLRVHNMLNLYGGLMPYWQAIKQQLQHKQLTFYYATGTTPLAAKLLSQSAYNQVQDAPNTLKQAVLQQPIQRTELAPKTIEKLQRVGINHIGDLASLSLSELAKRFDIDLVTYLGRLLGELQHSVRFYHPEKQFNRRIELLYEIESTDRLQVPLQQLLEGMEQFLKIREQVATALLLTLYQREKTALEIELSAADGEYRAESWQTLWQLKLEAVVLNAPLYAIALQTIDTQVKQPVESDLFSNRKKRLSDRQLLAQLQAKLGDESVQELEVGNDYRPEKAALYTVKNKNTIAEVELQANRPLFIFPKPTQLKQQVTIISGPERIEFGWWEKNQSARDYFIARSKQGQWYWVFRTEKQHWFVHGIFS